MLKSTDDARLTAIFITKWLIACDRAQQMFIACFLINHSFLPTDVSEIMGILSVLCFAMLCLVSCVRLGSVYGNCALHIHSNHIRHDDHSQMRTHAHSDANKQCTMALDESPLHLIHGLLL